MIRVNSWPVELAVSWCYTCPCQPASAVPLPAVSRGHYVRPSWSRASSPPASFCVSALRSRRSRHLRRTARTAGDPPGAYLGRRRRRRPRARRPDRQRRRRRCRCSPAIGSAPQNGRVEMLFADGSTLHLDHNTVVDFQSDEVIRLLERARPADDPRPAARASPIASTRRPAGCRSTSRASTASRVARRHANGSEVELAVLRGARRAGQRGRPHALRAGERAFARAGAAPRTPTSSTPRPGTRSIAGPRARRDDAARRVGAVPPRDSASVRGDVRSHGYWQRRTDYGYVWYPRVARRLAPVLPRPLGEPAAVGAGPGLAPTRGPGRRTTTGAGASRPGVVLDSRPHLGTGVGVLGLRARLRELVSARLEQPAGLPVPATAATAAAATTRGTRGRWCRTARFGARLRPPSTSSRHRIDVRTRGSFVVRDARAGLPRATRSARDDAPIRVRRAATADRRPRRSLRGSLRTGDADGAARGQRMPPARSAAGARRARRCSGPDTAHPRAPRQPSRRPRRVRSRRRRGVDAASKRARVTGDARQPSLPRRAAVARSSARPRHGRAASRCLARRRCGPPNRPATCPSYTPATHRRRVPRVDARRRGDATHTVPRTAQSVSDGHRRAQPDGAHRRRPRAVSNAPSCGRCRAEAALHRACQPPSRRRTAAAGTVVGTAVSGSAAARAAAAIAAARRDGRSRRRGGCPPCGRRDRAGRRQRRARRWRSGSASWVAQDRQSSVDKSQSDAIWILSRVVARCVISIARRAGIVAPLRPRRGARHRHRRDLRLRRRPAADLRARRLRAEHDHARLRRAAARSSASSRSSGARSSPTKPSRRSCEQAILAAEDDEFDQHFGLSIPRIIVTLDQGHRRTAQGAAAPARSRSSSRASCSSPTTRPGSGRSRRRMLAIQIEKRYTKREIFTLYCNQMYFGHGVYGVEAASRLYFGKSAKDVDARGGGADRRHPPGQRPAEPVRQHGGGDAAAELRARTGWPTSASSRRRRPTRRRRSRSSTAAEPPASVSRRRRTSSRKSARSSRAATAPSSCTRTACRSRPALDLRLQEAATQALDDGLRRIDKRRGFRKPTPQRRRRGPHGRRLPARRAGSGRCAPATSCRPS